MSDATDTTRAIVLDYLPHGRGADDHRRFDHGSLAHALNTDQFRLYELVLVDGADINIGDTVTLRPRDEEIEEFREIPYDELSSGATTELEYVIEETLEANPDRFIRVYNEAQPITLRLHQLNLLPGIGDKLRDDILDARKRRPFADYLDVAERISGIHDPMQVLQDRILEELQDDDVKYALFRDNGPY